MDTKEQVQNDHSSLHIKFPLYTIGRSAKGDLFIGGGGGESKSGLENAIIRVGIKRANVFEAGRESTGKEVVMYLSGHPKENVLACVAGQACYLYFPDEKSGERRRLLRKEVSTDRSQKLAVFNPNGASIMLATEDGRVLFLSYPTMKVLYAGKIHDDTIYTAVYNPTGTEVITTSSDKSCKITRVHGCKPLKTLVCPSTDPTAEFRGALYSPTGDFVYTTHHVRKGSAVLTEWNTKTWEVVRSVTLHESPSTALALSPNGKYFASGNPDGLIVAVERKTFNKTFSKQVHSFFVSSVAWTKDSCRILSVSGDHTCHLTHVVHQSRDFIIGLVLAVLVALIAIIYQVFFR